MLVQVSGCNLHWPEQKELLESLTAWGACDMLTPISVNGMGPL